MHTAGGCKKASWTRLLHINVDTVPGVSERTQQVEDGRRQQFYVLCTAIVALSALEHLGFGDWDDWAAGNESQCVPFFHHRA